MLVRKDVQRLNKRVVQGRGAFAREDGIHVPRQGMPIDIGTYIVSNTFPPVFRGLDLSKNPDFSIGPQRQRFRTNTSGGMQARAATLSEQRQIPVKQDNVQMPVSS